MMELTDISRYEQIYDELRAARQKLLNAPQPPAPGAYLVEEQVSGKNFVQVVWKAKRPVFQGRKSAKPTKSLYVGKAGSPAHREAEKQWQNHCLLKEIDKQVSLFNEQIDRLAKLSRILQSDL